MNDEDRQWHLDKRVPLALIFALIMQAGGFGWFAATISAQVNSNSHAIVRLNDEAIRRRDATQALAIQLGRIEENTRGLRGDMNRLLSIFERSP